jgi:UDP-N-acetylglucosamine--N-acetylmuramyl-(pentapeptide) pyrophosphoryl-undecaprenol N-acetylglucosamine transferase
MITGNPVRSTIAQSTISQTEGVRFFSLDENKKTVLVIGGSLGAKSINEAIDKHLNKLLAKNLQLIWQTGKEYAGKAAERAVENKSVWANSFINQMEYAYAAADIVVSRSGAMVIAELCIVKKPVLFVPYPFAAEDHQTVNAMKLVKKNAALMVEDKEAINSVVPMILELASNENKQNELKKNIGELGIKDADKRIASEILKVIG